MAKTTSDTPSASAEETLSRQKKQARREAKLMLEIEEAHKDLKKAQKKQSKAQARLEMRSAYVHTLETRLEELRAPSLKPAIEMPQDSAEPERQQVPSELDGSIAHSDEYQQAPPETEVSTFTGEGTRSPGRRDHTLCSQSHDQCGDRRVRSCSRAGQRNCSRTCANIDNSQEGTCAKDSGYAKTDCDETTNEFINCNQTISQS